MEPFHIYFLCNMIFPSYMIVPNASPSHISSPDITFCTLSEVKSIDTLWSTAQKLASGHLPIFIMTKTTHKQKQGRKTFISYKKANWSAYTEDTENLFH